MNIFKLSQNNTNIKQEFSAGLTTFLAMVYIVPLNALIMSETGMPYEALVTATALITILSCVFNGIYANTPITLSVGMGLNAYFTYGICKSAGISWQIALGIVFLSGILFVILSFVKFRTWIVKAIPLDLRRAISAGIGAFICFIGFKEMGIVVSDKATLIALGNLKDPNVLLGLFGLILMLAFWILKIKGNFILAITITSIVAWIFNISPRPESFLSMPSSIAPIFAKLDVLGALKLAYVPFIVTFFITHLFDSIGVITGVGNRAKIFKENDLESEKKLSRNLTSDALASVAGSIVGTSTVTAFAESASGVEAGGKTGLTAVFAGLLFVLTLFLLPLFKAIPANAIYPVLVMVGILMFSELGELNYSDPAVLVPTFFIVMLMPFTYSITNGLSFGFISYAIVKLLQRKFSDLNLGVISLVFISLIVLIMHH